ncbi:23S ribosomal RNA methyltransferase Erm [Streptomyces spinoverrucosus]|uniref:23S ribosomal RNA methyltransferase Erm n=1 Tax=Streptomyces spinoverrucosus TaxID=284043 RepID=UPI0018C37A15|nr:23S ribosomal RNA methyltransferase Erm [Streptomyces spinoverrucosus]MBG0853323.1 23S ribosomal RNA methyltransferase Erm [Streptomyces spinoverrucosus]
MRTQRPGRHELGQNFLVDPTTIDTFVHLVADTDGPIIEIGTGDGALTLPLQRLGRPLTGVEIDGRRAARLARRVQPPTTIVHADFLRFRLPTAPHVLVGNLPFHQTTGMLRRILHAPGWTEAVLLVQWEVARRRAGVGGATMMTAQWWPWFAFGLAGRVPATAFRPRPGVDGGLLTVSRRERPLLPAHDLKRYQAFVQRAFTGRGRGLAEILAASLPHSSRRDVQNWLRRQRLPAGALPKNLTAEQWAELYRLGEGAGAR